MTLRHRKKDPLADVFRSQAEEIKKYKWIESEKLGRDIGWEGATLCRNGCRNTFLVGSATAGTGSSKKRSAPRAA